MKVCRTAKGVWEEYFVSASNPHGKKAFWLSGSFTNLEPEADDTDDYALQRNYVSVTPIKVDFTDYATIKELETWNL